MICVWDGYILVSFLIYWHTSGHKSNFQGRTPLPCSDWLTNCDFGTWRSASSSCVEFDEWWFFSPLVHTCMDVLASINSACKLTQSYANIRTKFRCEIAVVVIAKHWAAEALCSIFLVWWTCQWYLYTMVICIKMELILDSVRQLGASFGKWISE